eukprot:gb/GECH01009735.1/.p1 GENE.gb/GECH01009735.1/~~gb/GECH01009735.1/.p1  ORF type:complete len:107 (+),score=34.52 gb/GECH01009735.1/:1-321(+)
MMNITHQLILTRLLLIYNRENSGTTFNNSSSLTKSKSSIESLPTPILFEDQKAVAPPSQNTRSLNTSESPLQFNNLSNNIPSFHQQNINYNNNHENNHFIFKMKEQ